MRRDPSASGVSAGRLIDVRTTGVCARLGRWIRRSRAPTRSGHRDQHSGEALLRRRRLPQPSTHADRRARRSRAGRTSSAPARIPTASRARRRCRARSGSALRDPVRGSGGRCDRARAGGRRAARPDPGSSSRKTALATSAAVSPRNARVPDSISYSTAPSANRSVRASTACPRTCSGDM